MCGIIAYLGNDHCNDHLIHGLKMLQNRGYDSAGISVIHDKCLAITKCASTTDNNAILLVEQQIHDTNYKSTIGIGHTRWATHGGKTDANAHPHCDTQQRISLVHNGIIENYQELKSMLMNDGYVFSSQTDTEVIAAMIGHHLDKQLSIHDSIQTTLSLLKGTWALCVIHKDFPNSMWVARNGSPLLLGMCDEYIMIASESIAFGKYIQKYIVLENNDLIEISLTDNKISYATNIQRYKIHYADQSKHAELPPEHAHWMIKEIYDQPGCVINATGNGGRIKDSVSVKLGGLDGAKKYLDDPNHLVLLGCGTSYHAGLWSTRLFREYDVFDTVSCIDGAEFNIDDIPKRGKTVAILLSQSGETKDLHRCIDIARSYDIATIGVVNVEDSLIARETDCGVYLHAGREHAVASTKSFTTQCVVLSMIAVWFAQNKGVHLKLRQQCITDLHNLSYMLGDVIAKANTEVGKLVPLFNTYRSAFILGKGECEAIARESSLKIKEVCYLHAEGYSTSALKHGPFALIENGLPVILIDVQNIYREKNINAYNELTSRNAIVIVVTDEPSEYSNIGAPREQILPVGKNNVFGGVLANTYMQMLSYHLAIERGHNPDYPRNLAKVVTVE